MGDTEPPPNTDDALRRERRKFSVSANREKASHKVRYVETGGGEVDLEECVFCESVPGAENPEGSRNSWRRYAQAIFGGESNLLSKSVNPLASSQAVQQPARGVLD